MSGYVELLRQFSNADRLRIFSFSSGVDGALSLRSDRLLALLAPEREGLLRRVLLAELARCLIFALIPVLQIALISRTFARRYLNRSIDRCNIYTVISLGPRVGAHDPYFGAFLATTPEPYNYLKIVGGLTVRTSQFDFIESALPFASLVKLLLFLLFQPLLVAIFVVRGCLEIQGHQARLAYGVLALREMRLGKVYLNLLLKYALDAHVREKPVRSVFFPMEGRTWEKNLVRSARAAGGQTYGYLHCALTPRHISLVHQGFYAREELPDAITTAGAVATRVISNTFPSVSVRKGYFIRSGRAEPKRTNSALLLFALTESIDESTEILDRLAALDASRLGRVVVRLNPTSTSYRSLRVRAESLGLALYDDSVTEVPGFCFFRSASVAIEYLRLGATPVYLDLCDAAGSNCFALGSDAHDPFPVLRVDADFQENLKLFETPRNHVDHDALKAIANMYLDQEFDPIRLRGLDELS